MAETLQHNDWSGKTDGQPWMQRSLIAVMRVLPLWMLYFAMALVVPFYMPTISALVRWSSIGSPHTQENNSPTEWRDSHCQTSSNSVPKALSN